jgi:hypothetical protein
MIIMIIKKVIMIMDDINIHKNDIDDENDIDDKNDIDENVIDDENG